VGVRFGCFSLIGSVVCGPGLGTLLTSPREVYRRLQNNAVQATRLRAAALPSELGHIWLHWIRIVAVPIQEHKGRYHQREEHSVHPNLPGEGHAYQDIQPIQED
jgi:hypothetical protein